MRSTKKKAIEKDGVVFAQGKMWTKEGLESFRKYQTEFRKKQYRMFTFRFVKDKDQDMIKWLESKDNLTEYLATLIRKDMKKAGKK